MRTIHVSLISLILLAACGQPNTTGKTSQKHDSLPAAKDSSTKDTTHYTFVHADDYADKPSITLPPALAALIPSGYSILDTANGDLNRDSYPDMIIIAKKNGEDSLDMEIAGQRPLLILTGQPDGSLKLAARNDNVVLCYRCGGALGDPYQETIIKKGYFSLEYYGGANERWSRIVTFKYSPADSSWYLHKVSEDSFLASDSNPKHTLNTWSEKELGVISFTGFNSDTLYYKLTDSKLR